MNLINPILVASCYVFTFISQTGQIKMAETLLFKNNKSSRDNTTYREPKENLIVNRESQILFKKDAPRTQTRLPVPQGSGMVWN